MQVSAQGLALITQFEGFSAQVYTCPAGKKTIGYGHVVAVGEDFSAGISRAEARELLIKDTAATGSALTHLVKTALNQHQFDALVSLVYNIGIGAFAASTLLKLLNNGQTAAAAEQFTRWDHIGGVKLDGLMKRRGTEMALFQQDVA